MEDIFLRKCQWEKYSYVCVRLTNERFWNGPRQQWGTLKEDLKRLISVRTHEKTKDLNISR